MESNIKVPTREQFAELLELFFSSQSKGGIKILTSPNGGDALVWPALQVPGQPSATLGLLVLTEPSPELAALETELKAIDLAVSALQARAEAIRNLVR